jgi:ubiquinol-cytochrome c reductase iron-sulfur subunit
MAESSTASMHHHGAPEGTKRDFIKLIAGAGAAIGTGAIAWPIIDSMNPSKDVLALASIEVDLAPVVAGQGITVMWRGKPVFVRHRTPEEIKEAQAVPLSQLPDPQADSARVKPGQAQWLVLIGICPHLGCIPGGNKPTEARGEYGGWFCACHGSQYDTSGRIRKGPSPANLAVAPFEFLNPTKIKIG